MIRLKKFHKVKNAKPLHTQILWYIINYYFFNSSIPYPNGIKIWFLRVFGARVGTNVLIKPRVRVKRPWLLSVGNNSWIGEDVWIDNIDFVEIGSDVCISQRAFIINGNHDFKSEFFDLIHDPISIGNNSWVTAGCVLLAGVSVPPGTMLEPGKIYTRNSVY